MIVSPWWNTHYANYVESAMDLESRTSLERLVSFRIRLYETMRLLNELEARVLASPMSQLINAGEKRTPTSTEPTCETTCAGSGRKGRRMTPEEYAEYRRTYRREWMRNKRASRP